MDPFAEHCDNVINCISYWISVLVYTIKNYNEELPFEKYPPKLTRILDLIEQPFYYEYGEPSMLELINSLEEPILTEINLYYSQIRKEISKDGEDLWDLILAIVMLSPDKKKGGIGQSTGLVPTTGTGTGISLSSLGSFVTRPQHKGHVYLSQTPILSSGQKLRLAYIESEKEQISKFIIKKFASKRVGDFINSHEFIINDNFIKIATNVLNVVNTLLESIEGVANNKITRFLERLKLKQNLKTTFVVSAATLLIAPQTLIASNIALLISNIRAHHGAITSVVDQIIAGLESLKNVKETANKVVEIKNAAKNIATNMIGAVYRITGDELLSSDEVLSTLPEIPHRPEFEKFNTVDEKKTWLSLVNSTFFNSKPPDGQTINPYEHILTAFGGKKRKTKKRKYKKRKTYKKRI